MEIKIIALAFFAAFDCAYCTELPPFLSFLTTSKPVEYGHPVQPTLVRCGSQDLDGFCISRAECRDENGKGHPVQPTLVRCGSQVLDGFCISQAECRDENNWKPLSNIRSSNQCKPDEVCCSSLSSNGQSCGWRNNSVPGSGDERQAGFAEFPWMVAVFLVNADTANNGADEELVYIGGGSLIHPRVVLTVAHYVATVNLIKVRAGEWKLQTGEDYEYQESDVRNLEIHEDFDARSMFNDIALLFLAKAIDPAPNVGVVCLPPRGMRAAWGARCFASGWGKDKFERGSFQDTLKKVEVPVVSRSRCQDLLRRTRLSEYFELHKSFMCAGGERGVDTCYGDGGSPLVCPIEENRFVQHGIVSWGMGCGQDGTPGVYVDVGFLRSWIDDKVRARGFNPSVYTI